MPLFSAFTPFGLLAFSGAPSKGEKIYRAMKRAYGDGENYADTGLHDAKVYATAMTFARAGVALERMANQADPRKITDLLPGAEKDHRLRPGARATLAERRGALAARMLLPSGCTENNLKLALEALLGASFVRVWTPPVADAILWPENPQAGHAPANLRLPNVPRKLLRLAGSISTTGSTFHVPYVALDGSEAEGADVLEVNDRVMVEPEHNVLAERVTVTHVGPHPTTGEPSFGAVFSHPHHSQAILTTQPYPAWSSTKRFWLVILKPAAARDPETRRVVHDLMGRMVRGVTQWSIAEETTPGHSGPFQIGITPLGTTTVTLLPPP